MGIVRIREIWATDVNYLNESEFRHAVSIANQALTARPGAADAP